MTYLNPIVAIILGVLVLNETITPGILAGIALVLSGVALTRYRTQPAQAAQDYGQDGRTGSAGAVVSLLRPQGDDSSGRGASNVQ